MVDGTIHCCAMQQKRKSDTCQVADMDIYIYYFRRDELG
jgi:hypothetical protein